MKNCELYKSRSPEDNLVLICEWRATFDLNSAPKLIKQCQYRIMVFSESLELTFNEQVSKVSIVLHFPVHLTTIDSSKGNLFQIILILLVFVLVARCSSNTFVVVLFDSVDLFGRKKINKEPSKELRSWGNKDMEYSVLYLYEQGKKQTQIQRRSRPESSLIYRKGRGRIISYYLGIFKMPWAIFFSKKILWSQRVIFRRKIKRGILDFLQ